jgi:tetratricopeptide (TPR) repeat protein
MRRWGAFVALLSVLAGGVLVARQVGAEAPEPGERSSAELWIESNRAYEEGRYPVAAAGYQELVDRGLDGGWVLYNLGNARLRNGELGRAVAAYRAASARLPRNGDVEANLAFARQSARDAIAPPAPSVALRTLFFWHFGLSRAELVDLLLICNVLFWTLLSVRLFLRRSEVLQWALTAILVVTVALGASVALRGLAPARIAVVAASEVDAHSGTGEDTVVRFQLHAGSELRWVEEREGWIRIELPDGQQGWIERRHAEVVTL